MKAFLLYKDCDFDLQQKLPWNEQALIKDLELSRLFSEMALGDKFVFELTKNIMLSSLVEPDIILYRQNILKDCIRNSSVISSIYNIAVESIENEKVHSWSNISNNAASILQETIDVLQILLSILVKLRNITDINFEKFESEGFQRFFTMIKKELDDEFFSNAQNQLEELKFRNGVLISAELGKSSKGDNYKLCKLQEEKQSWLNRIFTINAYAHSVHINQTDVSAAKALSELKARGINLVVNSLAQSVDHILGFFSMLRMELAFYVGCLNLYEKLTQKGEPVSFPVPVAQAERKSLFIDLYDVSLSLSLKQRTVGNSLAADNKELVIITGANQGGKSTFLRSIGIAQLMMQCGMFVPAVSFCSNVCEGIYTHFRREEDTLIKSGKLDEELSRMNNIADTITSNSMILFNESFAATNEREGSEIARQIISALFEKHVKVFFVTHLFEFAYGFHNRKIKNVIFLRAQRQTDGSRSFIISEGEPLQTSFGEDLYYKIFKEA